MATPVKSIPQIGSDHPYAKYLRRVRSLFTEKWFDVGSELLEPGDERQLKIIKSNNKLSLDESCAEMLDLWIEKQPDASWDQLIEALSAPGIEMYSVASKIKSMLIKGPSAVATQDSQPSLEPMPQNALTFASNESIQSAFIRLSKSVQQAIKHTDFLTVKQASMESAMFPTMALKSKEIRSIVQASQTSQTLIDLLTEKCYWNFLDTRMMEAMATASGVPAAQESIINFKHTFYSKKVKKVAPQFLLYERDKSDLTLIKEVCDKDMTIAELNDHRFFIETELFGIGPGALTVCKIVIGSIKIEWQISIDHVYQAYTMLKKKFSLLASHSIVDLSIPEVIRWEGLPILWHGQEVGHIGPCENEKQLCSLPAGLEWTILNSDSFGEIMELYNSYTVLSKSDIQWSFEHPQHETEFVFGVRESSSKKLVWAIWCVPYHISIKGQLLPVVELQQEGMNYDDKQDEVYNVVTREAMRRASKFGMSQSVLVLQTTHIIKPTITLPVWVYDFSHPTHILPYNSPRTTGLRRMTPNDIASVLALTNLYVSQFEIAQIFQTENELLHYFLWPSTPNYMVTYVIEGPGNDNITDLFGFRLHAFNDVNNKVIKSATVSVIVNTKTPTRQLITDLLLCAKHEQVDVLTTQQFGLSTGNFEDLLVHDYQYEYWHIFNYNYPEVDENNCCVFYSSLAVGVNNNVYKRTIVSKSSELSASEESEQVVDQQFEDITKPKRPQKAASREHLTNFQSLFAEKWYDIGLELLHSRDETCLRLIKSSKREKIECCAEMLELWLDRQPDASWNQLIDALRSPGIELFDVASKLEGMLIEESMGATEVDEKSPSIATCNDNKSSIEDYSTHYDNMSEDLELGSRDVIPARVLHKAVESSSVKTVEILVNAPHEEGIGIAETDETSQPVAAFNDDKSFVEDSSSKYCNEDLQLELCDTIPASVTILHKAAEYSNVEVVEDSPHEPLEKGTGVTEVDEMSLIVAACDDNISLIEDYLTYCDTMDKDLQLESHDMILAKVLHKGIECCSVKVVETLVNSPHVDVTYVDPENGWNALHVAAAALESFVPASNYKNLRKIIYLLFKRSVNPTTQDLNGRTPLNIALLSCYDRLTALFELLQKIWNSRSTDYIETQNVPIYIHKELLQWAIELDFEEMVHQILLMNPKLSRGSRPDATKANRRNSLLGIREDGWSAFHLATEQKCVNAFRALLAFSGFTLTEIVNFCPKGSEQSRGEKVTPLSSILINYNDDANPMMDILIEFDKNYREHGNFPITNVDLSYTYIGNMLSPIIFRLKSIRTLSASNMQLSDLPFDKLSHYSQILTQLDISSNNLSYLPDELFTCLHLEHLNVSYNPLGCLPENWWKSRSLCHFCASSTNLKEIFSTKFSNELPTSFVESQGYAKPAVYQRPIREISQLAVFKDGKVSKLKDLILNENSISEFPHCFACIFPQLEILDLSKNKLTTACCIQELPAALVKLDLSYNRLSSSDTVPFVISPVCSCFASQSALACGHMLHCELPRLQELCLSHNRNLNKLNFTCLPSDNLVLTLHENDNTEHVFFPNLTKLEVNNCQLRDSPCHLDLMSKLCSLDISDNPIRNIPLEICNLEGLEDFKYNNILDELLYELDQRKTVTAKRYFLKFYKDEAVSDPSVRLMFVGLSGRGKSTLLRHLRWAGNMATVPVGWRDRMNQEDCDVQHTIGVDQDVWYYSRSQDEPVRDENNRHKIISFYTWDFAGQEEYYATHQCFLTRKALYVICWRVTDSIKGVMELKEWLLSIQAKAKDAAVVIVGTHVDKILRRQRIQVCEDLHKLIQTNYCSGSPYYPDIKGIKFVACPDSGQSRTDLQPIIELRKYLYDIASSMMVTIDSRYPKLKLIDQKIPRKYKTLQEFILAEAASIRRHKQPPIVKFNDLQKKLQTIKELQAMDKQELYYSLLYLKDNVAHNGHITIKQFYDTLTSYDVTNVNIELLLVLLCKFEIAIKLNAENVLIPALLDDSQQTTPFQPFRFPPKESTNFSNINVMSGQKLYLCSNKSCYRRLFMAPHVPVSFWPRFISRCLSSKYFCRILVSCGKNVTVKDCLTVNQAIVDGTLFQWQYGKEKIHLLFGNHVLLRVNKISDELSNGRIKYADHFGSTYLECHCREGFIVHVPGYSVVTVNDTDKNFICTTTFSAQILAHVLELIDQVMRDWFEGLLDRGIYSDDFLLQLIPCPYCFGDQRAGSVGLASSEHSDYINDVICFSVGFCLRKVQEMNGVECPQCQSENLMIKHIAPDMAFDDLTPNFKINSQLLINQKFVKEGGYGRVDKMTLLKNLEYSTGQLVAVKTIAASEENLAIRYGLTRIELNKLLSANHPNVLQFIGITVTPPAIVVEYALLGSLHDVTKQYREKGHPVCPASIAMILYQIGGALGYLHEDRYIVHCDIKPSNILVFAFPDADHRCISELTHNTLECTACENGEDGSGVLVKLADLGTACYIGPEGFSKRPTTPGHNAPEDILYLGKELLTEKVDVFSLGTTLFELMTHRDLPGIIHDVDFSKEIKHGRRPRFFPTDPKYPSIFNECLFSCWSQDYRHRPSATKIAQVFQPPHNISFLHSYPISRDPQGSCVVVSGDDSQYIWIVTKDGCSVAVSKFMESESIPAFDLIFSEILCFKDNPVKVLSQIGRKVWAVVKDGRIAICNIDCKNEELFYMQTEGFPIDAKEPIKICFISTDTVMLAYSNGLVVFATHQDLSPNSPLLMSISLHMNKLNCIQVIWCQITLHDVEVISCAKELWCGCDNGSIQIFDYSIYSSKGVIKLQSHSSQLPQNSAIVQLKSHSFITSKEMVVFALHHPGNVISCWKVNQQSLLKVIPLKFQASAILPLASSLFIGTICGRVLVYKFIEEKLTQLTGRHKQGEKVLALAAVNGKVTKNWLISSIGRIVSSTTGDQSIPQDDEDLPCDILLSLGSGYHEVFDSHLGEEGFQRVLTWCTLK